MNTDPRLNCRGSFLFRNKACVTISTLPNQRDFMTDATGKWHSVTLTSPNPRRVLDGAKSGASRRAGLGITQNRGVVMASCWMCGKTVKPNVRYLDCGQCQGSIVTPDDETKRDIENKQMMQEHDTHKRVRGKVKQTRYRG